MTPTLGSLVTLDWSCDIRTRCASAVCWTTATVDIGAHSCEPLTDGQARATRHTFSRSTATTIRVPAVAPVCSLSWADGGGVF
jgi:hypothetical protein